MTKLNWDDTNLRKYERGVDHGVLYLLDGTAIPWVGLTEVVDQTARESSPVYFDGRKINDLVALGDFSATLKALTYPDEFLTLEGMTRLRPGTYLSEQPSQMFNLSYRTGTGNGTGTEGHKIHILYNVLAIPKDKNYATQAESPNLTEFEWELVAVPVEVDGFRPTSHIVIDSLTTDPWLMDEIELMLYGDDTTDPNLMTLDVLSAYMAAWARITVVDNGDGTWTLTSKEDGVITINGDGSFLLTGVNAEYLDSNTYVLSSTADISEV